MFVYISERVVEILAGETATGHSVYHTCFHNELKDVWDHSQRQRKMDMRMRGDALSDCFKENRDALTNNSEIYNLYK